MRPLTVLILVLGAVTSLVFAIVSLTGGDRERVVRGADPVVGPAEAPPRDTGTLTAPVERAEPLAEITRRVQAEPEVVPAATGAHTGFLFGTVVDPEGDPVAGAELSLIVMKGGPTVLGDAIHLMSEDEIPLPVRKLRTDGAGRFRFDSIQPGNDWNIIATHDEFVRSEVGPIDVPPDGGAEERIVMDWGNVLRGRVVDRRTRAPIEGAVLLVENPLASFLPSMRRSDSELEAVTDANGSYSFKNLGNGNRALTLTAKGYATQYHTNFSSDVQKKRREDMPEPKDRTGTKRVKRSGERTRPAPSSGPVTFDFEMDAGQAIAGRVVGPDRAGIEGAEILAINQTGVVGSRGTARSGPGGEFIVSDLGPGMYTVRAEARNYTGTPLQRIEVGDTAVEVVLAEQGSVSGRAIDAATGKPLRHFTIRVRTHHPRNITWGGVVGTQQFSDSRDGAFVMSGITEGEYVVEASARGYSSSFSEPFRVEQGIETHDVVVRVTKGGSLKGRVFDSYTGEPIAGAKISTNDNNYVDSEIMNLLGALGQSATSKVKTTTNGDGEFVLDLLTPDTYQVRIDKDGYTAVIRNDVIVADGVVTDLGSFSLLRGAIVRGVVVGPGNEPIPGAQVVMHPSDNDHTNSYQGRTDANGSFRLRNARAGSYKLSASRPQGPNSNPFAPVVDLRYSEQEITIADNGEYEFKLKLGPEN